MKFVQCWLRFFVCTLVLLSSSITKADLFIDIQDATIVWGQLGSIDVLVRSDGSDPFSIASYKFKIEPLSGGGALQFRQDFNSTEVSSRQSNSEQSSANYLFFGATSPVNFVSARQDPVLTELVGGDESTTGNITLNSPTNFLLTRLELQDISPVAVTGSFRVSLVEDPDFTFFFNDEVTDDLQPKINAASYSQANSGIVNISISAVPEPSSILTLGLASGLSIFRRDFGEVVAFDHC